LIQGSVQPPPIKIARADWENAMQSAASENFSAGWKGFLPDENLRRRAEALACQKFSRDGFNQKR
jgi:hypothetical protein